MRCSETKNQDTSQDAEKGNQMKACTPNKKRDAKRNLNGESNIVGLFRRTRKGEKLSINGEDWGVEGKNGSDYYEVRVGADGIMYCNCMDYKIRGHKSNRNGGNYMCKHVRAFLTHITGMINRNEAMDSECIIYKPKVALAYASKFSADIAAGSKVSYAA